MGSHSDNVGHFLSGAPQTAQTSMLNRITVAVSLSLLNGSVVKADDGRVEIEVDVQG